MRQDEFRTRRARELRREMTPSEKRLWPKLRDRRFAGFKFRRQTPVAGFIADFYCAKARFIIELDGESHVGKKTADENRQRVIEAKGFEVVRVWDSHVFEDLDAVLEMIWRKCVARGGPPSPPTPLPRGERGAKPLPSRGEGRKSSPRGERGED